MGSYHVPVMLNECLEGLQIKPDGKIVDATFGGGGHSKAILKKLGKKGKLIAFDQDEDAKNNLPKKDERFIFIDQNFEFIKNHLHYQDLIPIDGMLADLGVSSHQFDTDERGFSFRFDDAPLDMRMDKNNSLTAEKIINTYTEKQLTDIFYQYGELSSSKKIASEIVHARAPKNIKSCSELKTAIIKVTPKHGDYKFLAQIFQALRIEVNQELEALKRLLTQSTHILKPKGRLVVMSYHSLEDRLVKNFMNAGNFEGETKKDFYGNIIRPFNPITRKVITPSEKEIEKNPRARSAKLRVAEKL